MNHCYFLKNVLLIEDSPSYSELVLEAFETVSQSCRVDAVSNGEAALEWLHRSINDKNIPRPDLILLDLHLPNMSGLELLKKIKTDNQWQAIPVIVLSASQQKSDIYNCYQQLANCYIKKPATWDNLINLIKSIISFWFQVATLPPSQESWRIDQVYSP